MMFRPGHSPRWTVGCEAWVRKVNHGHGRSGGHRSSVCDAYALDADCAAGPDQYNLDNQVKVESRGAVSFVAD